MFFRQLRSEDGFAITTLLLIISVSSALIVGGSSTAASVLNKQDITESTLHMRDVANVIRDRGTDIGGDQGAALRGHARRMIKVANLMDDRAMDEIVSNAVDNAGDALLTPLQGGKVIQGAQFLWDLKGGAQLADTTMTAWGASDPATDQVVAELQDLKPATDYSDPVEQAIVEAKLTATRNALEAADLGLSPTEIEEIVVPALVDIETDNQPPPDSTGPFSNPFWAETSAYIGLPPPATQTTGTEPTAPGTTSSTPGEISAGDPSQIAACLVSQGWTIVSGPIPHGWNDDESIFFWEVTAQLIKPGYSDELMTMFLNDCGRCTTWQELEPGSAYYVCR